MAKFKYYVVWQGKAPGIYDSWEECKQQIDGYPNAKYKSFTTKDQAAKAFRDNMEDSSNALAMLSQKVNAKPTPSRTDTQLQPPYIIESICVDAACSGNPGPMEYRAVYTKNNTEIFRIGPLEDGTNNVGEFLALVHGLALLKQKQSKLPIYSDSMNAISWVRKRKCNTKLAQTPRNAKIFEMIERAEIWLNTNTFTTRILKWDTKEWGEIPADFGRK